MVSEVAEAVSQVARVAYEVLHQSQRELIDEAYEEASHDVGRFKAALLAHDIIAVQLLLDGLMFGIKADITVSEFNQLRGIKLGQEFDAYDLLGLYCRARGAGFAQRVNQIIQTEDKPK